MALPRIVEPELADSLPADDLRAIRFRRDLRRLNALVMSDRVMAGALARACGGTPPRTVADLGTGDGTLMLRVAQRLRWPGVSLILVDQQDIVSAETRAGFAALGWTVQVASGDVFDFLDRPGPAFDLITAHAFLHHFADDRLRRLFAAAARRTGLLVASEPRRTPFAREASRVSWLLGFGEVAVRDMVTSVKAGFAGTEMTQCWPASPDWALIERDAGPLMHLFVAKRRANATA